MKRIQMLAFAVAAGCAVAAVRADEVIFKNGDRMTGTVLSIDGGKLKFKSDMAGEINVDLKDVQTFTTAEPLQTRLKDNTIVNEKASAPAATQPAGEVMLGDKPTPVTDIKSMNSPTAWTGSVVVNGSIVRGNTHSMDLGVAFNAALRRDDENYDDRFSLAGAYNFGNQTVNGVQTTSTDNWFAQGKYDKFFDEKLYGFGVFRVDHDRLAALNYRLAPGVGVGYQWVESADLNFSTEAGVSYIYEDYTTGDSNEFVALRLAYHVDKALNDKVKVFHNLEWLPAFEDPGDYILNTDAGIRTQLTAQMFAQFKIVYQRDSTPAPGALKNDTRFMLGVGWAF